MFLSCLLGSERPAGWVGQEPGFLSCLLGSELVLTLADDSIAISELPTRQ